MIRMLARVGILFHFVDNSDLRHIELTIFFLILHKQLFMQILLKTLYYTFNSIYIETYS